MLISLEYLTPLTYYINFGVYFEHVWEVVQEIRVARRLPGVGWAPAETIQTYNWSEARKVRHVQMPPPSVPGMSLQLAVDGRGGGVAAFRYSASLFAGAWTPSEPLAWQDVAMDGTGRAVAVTGQGATMAARHSDPVLLGWEEARTFGEAGASPRVAADGSGRAIVLWARSGLVEVARFEPFGGWQVAGSIASGAAPNLAMNAPGEAVAVWAGSDGLGFRRYAPVTGWEDAGLLSLASTGSAEIAINDSGQAHAAWQEEGAICSARIPGSE